MEQCVNVFWLLVGLSAAALQVNAAAAPSVSNDVRVLAYDVKVEPDLSSKSIRGRTTVRFEPLKGVPTPSMLAFDAGGLVIDSARIDGSRVDFVKSGGRVIVDTSSQARLGVGIHELDFYYHGSPQFGVEFHPERGEVYTVFSSSEWMVCRDDPSVRAPLQLQVLLPPESVAIASGTLVSTRKMEGGRIEYTWSETRAIPSFLYGFAAGRYNVATVTKPRFKLKFLSVERTPEELKKIFADTADMVGFFEERSGIPYHGMYSQALVARTIGQEVSQFAVLSETYGKRVLEGQAANPAYGALIAHELAHQWWGLLVTNESWNHFWLNEGFAVFMSAAYLEHRYGPAVYRDLLFSWQKRVDEVVARGKNHALVYTSWNNPTADDRAVVYQRGAIVLHDLRQLLGERAFWSGIKLYTRRYVGRSVNTADFQNAMEEAAGRNLQDFFRSRVYGAE